MKIFLLIAVGIAALVAGHMLTGVESMPTIKNDGRSIVGFQNHLMIVAAVTGAIVCLMGFILKESLYKVSLAVMIVGVVYIASSHVVDPDTYANLDEAVVKLLIPFFGVSSPIVVLIYGFGKWLGSRASHSN